LIRMKILFLPVVLGLVTGVFSFDRGDFLLLKSPDSCRVYNQYEQNLTRAEKAELLPFSPMQIVNPNAKLGDQITGAIRCVFGQKPYYLLKDEKWNASRLSTYGRVFKGCQAVNDTVEILRDGTVKIFQNNPAKGPSRMAAKGTRLIRFFLYQGGSYVLEPSPTPRFGWVQNSQQNAWKRVVHSALAPEPGLRDGTLNRLQSRMESANQTYKEYFIHFNQVTGQDKSIPAWQSQPSEGGLLWVLSEPYKTTGELSASTQRLVRDLENILLGSSYVVSCNQGQILVAPKR
jgi:hypothetical protein